MADERITPKFELLIDGEAAGPEVLRAVTFVRVRQHLDMADTIEVRLVNEGLDFTDGDTFLEGRSLAFKVGYEDWGGAELTQVAQGEIVRREAEFPVQGPANVTVVALDRRHRLKRGAHTRSFEGMTDADIARQIAGEVGLQAEVDDTGVTHDHVLQNAQTNLSFLRERALLYGYEVRVDHRDEVLYFKAAATGSGPAASLTWGRDLHSFHPRMSTDEQVDKVVVRGWDMKKKKAIVGTVGPDADRYGLDTQKAGAELSSAKFDSREARYTHRPVTQTNEATKLAEGWLNARTLRFCEGYGSCQGRAAIEAGAVIEVEGCGKRVNGRYYVTGATHFYEPRTGYQTHFDVVRSGEVTDAPPPPELPDSVPPSGEELQSDRFDAEVRHGRPDGG